MGLPRLGNALGTDIMSIDERSRRMARIRDRNTKPELAVRSMLHRHGFRFRLQARDLPGRPDIVFRRRRKALFVHGCFWHSHPGCRKNRPPKSKTQYWGPKLMRNRERQLRHQARRGWGPPTIGLDWAMRFFVSLAAPERATSV